MSHIVTNGLLFTEKIYQESVKHHWNLYKIQIPIDGYGDEYNKIKNYKTNKDAAFNTIINNLKFLVKQEEFRIDIRLNLSTTNKDELLKVIPYLQKILTKKDRIYCTHLFGELGDNNL
jgi:hypothetical protein